MRGDLPTGTVTFLLTDVEGSTRLLHELGAEAYAEALAEHRALIREACTVEGGVEVDTQGDAFFFAFPTAPGALAAAFAFTEALALTPIRVRVGLHTGTPFLAEEGYVGADVHFAARVAAAGHGGQVLVASSTAELVDVELTSLGSHRLKDIAEPVVLCQLGEGSFPPLKTIANTNLPTPASSFLGREAELYEADLLLQQTRLLTIAGPGGAGKTRFALELARRAREERFSDYADGVFSCFLASLRDPALVLPAIAQTLALPQEPGQSAFETLVARLEGKSLLLLLDNLEHLLGAASELSQLLNACPGLALLVTSRELLRVDGECAYVLPPLAPVEGVALFCERAGTEPSDTIAELCSRLEGLPLALELAAARMRLLSAEQLLERLASRLDLLKGGRDVDPRQQTLRATIEWSYDLLSEPEQRLFARLSVFAGGCTLEAAEEVCEAELDTLESLLDKSLLRRRDSELGPRYWMLESIREFAAEKLAASGAEDEMRNAHADFLLALAEELEPSAMGTDEAAMASLDPETDNLRVAIEFLSGQADQTRELRIVGALFRFWETSGLVVEGRRRAEHALARSAESKPALRAKVLYAASLTAYHQGDVQASDRYDEERLRITRALGDSEAVAATLNDLGLNAGVLGDLEGADTLLCEARDLAVGLGADEIVVAATTNLALIALLRGDPDHAVELLEEHLAVIDDGLLVRLGPTLGFALVARKDTERADEHLRIVLRAARRVAGPVHTCAILEALAAAAAGVGASVRAARLLGAAHAARSQRGILPDATDRMMIEYAERVGRKALGDELWDAEFARGEAMTLDDAVGYALEESAASGK